MSRLKEITPQELADLIGNSKDIVAITGAGISTSAGMPDFRGKNGLYSSGKYDPEKTTDIRWFSRDPSLFYSFAHDFITNASILQPTFTHTFLAVLESMGMVKQIITQNIDMLHQKAGSNQVVELHGSYRSATCLSCGMSFTDLSYDWWLEAMESSPRSPVALCKMCGKPTLKPDVVFFGESISYGDTAKEAIVGCDLLLILGSSLNVSPASYLPYCTNAPTVAVNQGQLYLDPGPNRYHLECDLDALFHIVALELSLIDIYGNFVALQG